MDCSDDHDVYRAIADLARSMHHTNPHNPVTETDILQEVTACTVKFFAAVDHASVSVLHRRGRGLRVSSAAPTGDIAAFVDRLQETSGMGPSVDAIDSRGTVLVDDFNADTRWPTLTAAVLADTPVRAAASLLLSTGHQSIGALNIYCDTPGVLDGDTVGHAQTLAAHAAVGISSVRRDEQFRAALVSRDLIGQAKGIVMERFEMNAADAFELLATLSQDNNVPVTDIAAEVVAHRTQRPH